MRKYLQLTETCIDVALLKIGLETPQDGVGDCTERLSSLRKLLWP